MHLKSVKMQGFKSFADTIELDFKKGITAIVGPNGSGKSNVADAIRWVLGEQSARALRGTKMEDVIFSGSEQRRQLSYCAVSLLFDNEKGLLDIPHTEVEVERRVYRSGEGEYLINKNTVRMRDIHSLFYDTGVGREGYSIIGQGKIEQMLSNKGEERRAALEEAAGVMKYKVRRDEATRKLNNVGQSMLRVQDIIGELELQLEPLAKQSEEAKEFLKLRDELKDLEISLFLEQYERNRERKNTLETREKEFAEQIEKEKEQIEKLREEKELAEEKLSLFEQLLEKAREKQQDHIEKLHETENSVERNNQTIEYLKTEKQRLEKEQQKDKEALQAVEQTLTENPDTWTAKELLQKLEEHSKILEDAANKSIQAADEVEEALNAAKQQWMDATTDDSERKQRMARIDTIISQANQRLEEIETQKHTAQKQFLLLEKEQTEDATKHQKLLEEHNSTIEKEKALYLQQSNAKEKATTLQLELQHAQSAANAAENRLRIQKELLRDFEGFANSVRNLLKDLQNNKISDEGVHGAIAELVRVPQQYEKAIEQALGGSLQNIVVKNEHTAKRLIEYLRENRYGRVTFLPLEALKPRVFYPQEKQQMTGQGVLGLALELIEYDSALTPAMEYALGRTVVVEDMDAGIALSRKVRFSMRCVTLEGDLINVGGSMTGGSVREQSLVSRERVVQEHEKAYQSALHLVEEVAGKTNRATLDLEEMEKTLHTLTEQKVQLGIEMAASSERLDAVKHQTVQAKERYASFVQELERGQKTIENARQSMPEESEIGKDEAEKIQQRIETLTAEQAQKRQQRDEATKTLAQAREKLSGQRSETDTLVDTIERLKREKSKYIQDNEKRETRLHALQKELENINSELQTLTEKREQIKENNKENSTALVKLEAERAETANQSKMMTAKREKLVENAQELSERKYRAQAQIERLEAEFENMQSRIWEEYELSYANALPLRKEIKFTESQNRAKEIRTRIREMDYVSPAAIEEYDRVSERYEFLTIQIDDLEQAKQDLEQLIDDLTEQMTEQFVTQFEIINNNFKRIFTALFKGGEAELVLSDEENAMECNIEIIAQPPGKRLQLISLLSGGERALCAIAMLFALLELKATPFCVLDEIDTALDEENLSLLADFLVAYSQHTQFIIITHRRVIMEAAETLYGIAMEEKGVSKLVSVRFSEGGVA